MNGQSQITMHFRAMDWSDIEAGLRLCRASNWNQTRREWELFLQLSPRGCRVALSNDQVVGTVATINYENRFSWIGMVLVDPIARGNGIGTALMNEALALLKGCPTIRLDATPAGRRVYQQLGFTDEYTLCRLEISGAPHHLPSHSLTRLMTPSDFLAVCKFDREVFGTDRRALLEWMFAGAPMYARVVERDRKIVGYSFGRHGHQAEHVGPVIARDQMLARQIVMDCLQQSQGQKVFIDAPLHQVEWRKWLEFIGFCEQRQLLRMFRGDNLNPGLPEKQFGILGPEFG